MPTQWRRWKLRDVALFLAIASIVSVLGIVIGREAGIGQQTGASVAPPPADEAPPLPQQQSEETTALTLTVSAPEVCETERGEGFAGQAWVYDDEGAIVGTRYISTGWANVAEIPVHWEVSGGTGPYTLVIDDEPRDGFGPYEGASGTASVSCAPSPGKVTYNDYDQHRWYEANPEIDSGPKTIRATVTDANGATAASSLSIYVIRQLGGSGTTISGVWTHHRLLPGRTYRYNGTLFTIPKGHTIVASSSWEAAGGGWAQVLILDGANVHIHINRHGEEMYRAYGIGTDSPQIVYPGEDYSALKDSLANTNAYGSAGDALDEFIASRGKLPIAPSNQ